MEQILRSKIKESLRELARTFENKDRQHENIILGQVLILIELLKEIRED